MTSQYISIQTVALSATVSPKFSMASLGYPNGTPRFTHTYHFGRLWSRVNKLLHMQAIRASWWIRRGAQRAREPPFTLSSELSVLLKSSNSLVGWGDSPSSCPLLFAHCVHAPSKQQHLDLLRSCGQDEVWKWKRWSISPSGIVYRHLNKSPNSTHVWFHQFVVVFLEVFGKV